MKARIALGVLVILLSISTVLGVSIATTYWDREGVDLRLDVGDALLMHVEFLPTVACSEFVAKYLEIALDRLLPAALNTIVDRSAQLLDSVDYDQIISGLVVQWTDDTCVFTYADGRSKEYADARFPVNPQFQEWGEGFKLTAIEWAISFTKGNVASALLSVRIADWASSGQPTSAPLDTTRFWDDGRVEIKVETDDKPQRVTVQLEAPVDGSHGIAAFRMPDLLDALAGCVRQHLETFCKNELDVSLAVLEKGEGLHSLALYAQRPCKIRGQIVQNCAMTHVSFINERAVDSSSESARTIPIGVGHLCYTIFGL